MVEVASMNESRFKLDTCRMHRLNFIWPSSTVLTSISMTTPFHVYKLLQCSDKQLLQAVALLHAWWLNVVVMFLALGPWLLCQFRDHMSSVVLVVAFLSYPSKQVPQIRPQLHFSSSLFTASHLKPYSMSYWWQCQWITFTFVPCILILTFWRRNYFFNFSTPCI